MDVLIPLLIGVLLTGPVSLILIIRLNKRVGELERRRNRHPVSSEIPVTRKATPNLPLIPVKSTTSQTSLKTPADKDRLPARTQVRRSESDPKDTNKPPAWERFVGIKALSWVGMLTCLMGIAYALKVAYEKGWIGALLSPKEITGFIYLAGIAIVAFSHWLRRFDYRFSAEGLGALGFGIIYAGSYCGQNIYNLFSIETAFVVTILTTICGSLMSGRYRSEFLAFLILLGGYITPTLLIANENHGAYIIGYLFILGSGGMVLNLFHRWTYVKTLSLIATYILFWNWYREYGALNMAISMTGTVMFFLLHSLALSLPSMIKNRINQSSDVVLAVANALVGFALLRDILYDQHRMTFALITFGLSAYYLAQYLVFRMSGKGRSPLAMAGIVLAIGFFTCAVPIELGPWTTTMTWVVQGTVLLAIGLSRKNQWVVFGGAACHLLSVIQLITSLPLHDSIYSPVFNIPFLSWTLACLAMGACTVLLHRELDKEKPVFRIRLINTVHMAYALATGNALYVMNALEILSHFELNLGISWRNAIPYLWLVGALVPLIYIVPVKGKVRKEYWTLSGLLHLVAFLIFLNTVGRYHQGAFYPVINSFFLCGVALFASYVVVTFRKMKVSDLPFPKLAWMASLTVIILLSSVEVYQFFYSWPALNDQAPRWALASLSVLWAIFGVSLLAIGFVRKFLMVRYAALVLFGLTLSKVFIVDTASLEPIYRIFGFLTLGAVLLAGSFAYAKFLRVPENG